MSSLAALERTSQVAYEIKVTLLEIYNESIQDLLSKKGADIPLKVVKGEYGMEVPDLTMVRVASLDDVINVMKAGNAARHVSKTDLNERSSRSHSYVGTLPHRGARASLVLTPAVRACLRAGSCLCTAWLVT